MLETILIGCGVFVLGVLLNALFAGYETGFVASNPIRVRHLAEQENDPQALRLLAYMEEPDRMITLVLVGTNVALVMGTVALTRMVGPYWAGLIATPAFLIFAEVVPKSMFRQHPTRGAMAFLPIMRFFDALLMPVVVPITWLSQRFLKLVGQEQRDIRSVMTSLDDMRRLVEEGVSQGTFAPQTQERIHSVIELNARQANEIMVPRINIQALPETASLDDVFTLFERSGRTRIPIYRENIDEVLGVVNAYELLADDRPADAKLSQYIKPVLHVPDSMKLDDLMRTMRDQRQTFAIVTDEYGGTDGLITLEDILEEIFGEIHDEYDREETSVRKVGPRAFVVDARTELTHASEVMGVALEDEEMETVGGWVTRSVGRIPQRGEVLDIDRFAVTVLDGTAAHLSSLRVEVRPKAETTPARPADQRP